MSIIRDISECENLNFVKNYNRFKIEWEKNYSKVNTDIILTKYRY